MRRGVSVDFYFFFIFEKLAPLPISTYDLITRRITHNNNNKMITGFYPFNRYFLEDIAFQHIANGVAEPIHNNITIAVRQSIKRYIIFQNASYPNTNGFTGTLSTGVHLKLDEISAYGMNKTHLRVKNVYVDMTAKNVTSEIEFNVHKLNGHFALRVDDSKPYTGKGLLNVSRVDAIAAVNVLNGKQCNANTVVHDVRVELDKESGLAPEINQYVAK